MTDRAGQGTPLTRLTLGPVWFAGVALLIVLAALPLSLQSQFILAAFLIGILAVIKFLRLRGKWRIFLIVLGVFIVVRYFIWRTTETIPFGAEPTVFVPGLLLYFAELYAVLILLVGAFSVSRRVEWPRSPLPSDPARLPTVDVFVPSYDEDPELLRTTLLGCMQMRYPASRLNVYLLDDGGTLAKRRQDDPAKAAAAHRRHETLKALCKEIGCHYLARERNEHAKAGNLNAALPRTHGELIAVFDADHVPTAEFLEYTVGHFLEDPDLFLVQTPHFFLNGDPLERNLDTFSDQPSENEMFYNVIQPGLDNWNATFFCGSAALLSRRALKANNGFNGQSITEDCETALHLHAQGFNSRYVRKPLIAGLQPETMKDFIRQRTRWAQGMMQIFILNNPLFKRGLTLPQRLAYTSSMMFWMFPFARLTMVLAPLLFLFFSLEIYEATVPEFLAYTLPSIIAMLIMSNFLYGRVRPPLISELYEFLQCTFLSRALLYVVLRPRAPKFGVTPKAEPMNVRHLSPLAGPLMVLVVLMLAGLVVSIWRFWTQPDLHDVFIVVSGWNVFNFLIGLAGLGVILEKPQRRRAPRFPLNKIGVVRIDGMDVGAAFDDASATGLQLRLPRRVLHDLQGGTSRVTLMAAGRRDEDRANWAGLGIPLEVVNIRPGSDDIHIGARFAPATLAHHRAMVRLVFNDGREWARFLTGRHREPKLLTGLGRFLRLSLRAGVRFPLFLWQLYSEGRRPEREAPSSDTTAATWQPGPPAAQPARSE